MKNITIIIFILLMSIWSNADSQIYTGEYECHTEHAEASFDIVKLSNNKYKIYGASFFGINSKYGPNFGILDFVAEMKNNTIYYKEGDYELILIFHNNIIEATETGGKNLDFGMNVDFNGKYKKIEKKKTNKKEHL